MSAALALTKKNLGLKAKPRIEIRLSDGQQDAFTPSYTSLDEIKGEISITSQANLHFDDIYITFEGSTKTYVEKIATTSPTNGKTEAFQNFLRLVQPLDPSEFPAPRVLEAHKTYRFAFNFVVPERLLPQSCTHPKDESFPEGAHLNLPPSLGDPMVSTLGKCLMDDMCPDMAKITYSVKCRLTSGRCASRMHMTIAEGSKKLRIAPALEEAPPLNAEGGEKDDYRLRKEKTIHRGMFRKKLGQVTAEAAQPKSLRLNSIHSDATCPVTTMATVNVRFDPEDEDAQPPKLDKLVAKLKVATFFASLPLREIPTKSCDFHYSSVKGIFVETIPLSSRCLANAQWERHTTASETGQDTRLSMSFASNIPMPSSAYRGRSFYTAYVVVPISLPKNNKVFVPSFHTCLISRIYALDLYLHIQTPKATAKDPQLHLKLPVQVSSEANPHPVENISQQEANAIAARAANEFFNPRNVVPPSNQFIGQANLSNPASSIRGTTSTASSPTLGTAWEESSPSTQATSTFPPSPNLANPTHPTDQRVSFAENVPPAPGPGWSHRSSWASGVISERPPQSVRMLDAQQRSQSLSFDNEEMAALAQARDAPPGYSIMGGRYREVIDSNVLPRRSSGPTV
ncbi:MAG: hypothetical protein Q9217_002860 [Psora testacea]